MGEPEKLCETCRKATAQVTVKVVINTTITAHGVVSRLPGGTTWHCCGACYDKHPLAFVFKSEKVAESEAEAGRRIVEDIMWKSCLTEDDRITARTRHAPSIMSRIDYLERTAAELIGADVVTLTGMCSAVEFSQRAGAMKTILAVVESTEIKA